MINIEFSNVKIEKASRTNEIVVKGEIFNKTGKNYASVVCRIIIFVKNIPISNVVIPINGLNAGMTKVFEKVLEDLRYDVIGKDISRCETYIDGAY